MSSPLVSVITGTYNRHRLLKKCIAEIRKQTYENIEHIIVSDGPDSILETWNEQGWPLDEDQCNELRTDIPIKFICTGRQWSKFLANSVSAVPFQMAQWLASGDYICWLADDEEITPDHIESLVNLLEQQDVDFVYSKSELWYNPELRMYNPPICIGGPVPFSGGITQALFRVELLDYCGFEPHVGSGTDWYQIKTWMDYGASWAFLDRVTHKHRVDKFGNEDRVFWKRQPLRGQRQERKDVNGIAAVSNGFASREEAILSAQRTRTRL